MKLSNLLFCLLCVFIIGCQPAILYAAKSYDAAHPEGLRDPIKCSTHQEKQA